MNIVLVDDDIEFSNKLKVDVKLYFKQLDENINFIVLNDPDPDRGGFPEDL